MVEFDAVHPSDRYRPMAQDPHPRIREYRVADASALVGSVVWMAVFGLTVLVDLPLSAVGQFVTLAMLVLTPLALGIVATRRRSGGDTLPYWVAVVGQPPAALVALLAFVVQPGSPTRELLVLPWVGVALAAAGFGLWRLGSRGPFPLPELAIDAGLLALPVGALALLLGGGPPADAPPSALDLAVVHAHYAGLALPLLAGRAGRIVTDDRGNYPRTAGGAAGAATTLVLVATLPLLGIGAADDGLLGLAAVLLLALAAVALGLMLLTAVVPVVPPRPAALLAITALALGVTMAFAPVAAATDLLDAGAMVAWHGTIGAVAAAVAGLAAFRLLG